MKTGLPMLRIVILGIDPYPKPLICMRGFVVNLGASLDEFAADVREILTPNLKNLH